MAAFTGPQLHAELVSLRRYAIRLAGNAADGDDLLQETALRAWAHREQFVPVKPLGAWLITILKNAHRGRVRAAMVQARHLEAMSAGLEEPAAAATDDVVIARQALRVFAGLRPQDQSILIGSALGNTESELAEMEGVAQGTVKSRLSRARGRLAAQIDPSCASGNLPKRQAPRTSNRNENAP